MFGRIVLDVPARVVKGKDGSEVAYNRFDEALDAAKASATARTPRTPISTSWTSRRSSLTYKKIVKDTIGRPSGRRDAIGGPHVPAPGVSRTRGTLSREGTICETSCDSVARALPRRPRRDSSRIQGE